ncbi:unnamed protein product [Owenia fusiformis]|uniref:Uncharacterized protein n=1 Tax=Owenia fusiformis TaxID=6347 RepID=A0A8J1TVS9_OWEFU|nr:unnamed protein product [Owenia fusiformis]
MNLQIISGVLILFVVSANAARSCTDNGKCRVKDYCNTKTGLCEKMVKPGELCTKNSMCKGSSTCEEVVDSDPIEKRCTERCKTDTDCRIYGKNKYCSAGGFATLKNGYCKAQKREGSDCSRSPECFKDLYCRNSKCKVAEEAVQCAISCKGPSENNPENLSPGEYVNVTYSCTFMRSGEYGPLPIKALLLLNKRTKLERVEAKSPVTISGSRAIRAGRGEFAVEVQGMMKGCKNHRKNCRASRRCIMKA